MAIRIYTKTGDKGSTALIGGTRVSKGHIRIEAYGTVDELNSHMGMIADLARDHDINEWTYEIQDRLFTIGSSLAKDPNKDIKMALPNLEKKDIEWLENKIDILNEKLPELKSFVLPGGHVASSAAHVARCVCRKAERICVIMQDEKEEVPEFILPYLNRLSDYLHVLARYILLINNVEDKPWIARK